MALVQALAKALALQEAALPVLQAAHWAEGFS